MSDLSGSHAPARTTRRPRGGGRRALRFSPRARAHLLAWTILLAPPAFAQDNFLILLADDVGVDLVGAYREHPGAPATPNIDRLAREGLAFRNAWANPACSAGRAALQTGRYGLDNDVGSNTKASGEGGPGLSLGEVTLPEMLGPGYSTALIGKWHLLDVTQGPTHPLDSGYGYHAGTLFNLGGDYYSWSKVTNGVPSTSTVYATTDSVNEAAAWIRSAPEPWLMVVCFNAAHGPLNPPPRDLHTLDLERADEPTLGRAIVQAMDTEIGRLLDSIDDEVRSKTTVFFLADNGSSESVTTPPFDPEHTKTSLYEGGINVPLIVAGPHVRRPGAFSNALVSVVDVFETVREIAGAGPTELPTDGVSLVPYFHDPYQPSLRETVYSEVFRPNGPPLETLHHKQAVRDERYKLINRVPGEDEFFDLWLDPFEQHNLLQGFTTGAQQAALGRLLAALPENRSSGGCTSCD